MVLFPNCKINLGLNIQEKRPDGYHNLETIFYPLPLYDALEVIHPPNPSSKQVLFSQSGHPLNIPSELNICIKAWHILKKDFPSLPYVQMHLHKNIPSGAGLGGGSADGAFTLMLLNQKFHLQLSEEHLMSYALQLGSDCPFFIINKPCFASGRGEIIEPLKLDLSAYKIVVVNPGIHIATGWAFSQLSPSKDGTTLKEAIQQPVESWQHVLINDFEKVIFDHHPPIKAIKEQLLQKGAVYATMTGTGSTVFGLFHKDASLEYSFPPSYFVKTLPLI
jgi:4-diphosphocytidyl-2-C-methyl-D-erythritol kinase